MPEHNSLFPQSAQDEYALYLVSLEDQYSGNSGHVRLRELFRTAQGSIVIPQKLSKIVRDLIY